MERRSPIGSPDQTGHASVDHRIAAGSASGIGHGTGGSNRGAAELAEGSVVEIRGASFEIDRVIVEQGAVAVLLANRHGRPDGLPSDPSRTAARRRFTHVDDDVQPLLWGPIDRRATRVLTDERQPVWLRRQEQDRVTERLYRALNERDACKRLLVVGPSGTGKKTAVARFTDTFGECSEAGTSPVIALRQWGAAKQLYERLLRAVGVSEELVRDRLRRPGMKDPERIALARKALEEAGVRMIVGTDYHFGSTYYNHVGSSAPGVAKSLRFLDEVLDGLDVVVVVTCDTVPPKPHRGPDLSWRHAERIDLGPLRFGDEFDAVLARLQRRLPLRLPSELTEASMAGRLHALSEGIYPTLWHILMDFAGEAILSGDEIISHELIDRREEEERAYRAYVENGL